MKKIRKQQTSRVVVHYTLRNKMSGWYRDAEGGHDTDNPDQAVVLGKAEAINWRKNMPDYEVIPLSEAAPI